MGGWSIDVRAPEARPIFERVDRAIALAERLNRLPYADQDAIRAAWAELTDAEVDPTFRLIPPVYSDQGVNIRVGRDVFINHNCTLNDGRRRSGACAAVGQAGGGQRSARRATGKLKYVSGNGSSSSV